MDAPTDRRFTSGGAGITGRPHATGVGLLCLYFNMGFSRPSDEYEYNAHALFMRIATRNPNELCSIRKKHRPCATLHHRHILLTAALAVIARTLKKTMLPVS